MPARRVRDVVCLNIQSAYFIFLGVAFFPLQERSAIDLGLSDNDVGIIQGPVVNGAIIVMSVPLGILADKFSRTLLLRCYAVAALAASVVTAVSDQFHVLAAARAAAALCVTAAWITSLSLLADLYPEERRGRGFTIFALVGCLPPAAAFASAGWLLQAFNGASDDWRRALIYMTLLAVPAGTATAFISEPVRSRVASESSAFRWTRLAALRPYLAMLCILIFARATLMIADGAAVTWAAPMYAREFALAPDRIGSIMSPILLVSALLGVSFNWIMTDVPYKRGGTKLIVFLAGLSALVSAPAAAFSSMSNLYLSGLLLLLFLALGNLVGLMSVVLATLTIPDKLRGVALGVLQTGGYLLGAAPAPVAVSYLASQWGGREHLAAALTVVCMTASVACAIGLLVGARWFPGRDRVDAAAVSGV